MKFAHKSRPYRSYKGTVGTVVKNGINRRFNTPYPYQKLTTDVTEFKIQEEIKVSINEFDWNRSLQQLEEKVTSLTGRLQDLKAVIEEHQESEVPSLRLNDELEDIEMLETLQTLEDLEELEASEK